MSSTSTVGAGPDPQPAPVGRLLGYLAGHRRTLAVVLVLSIIGAGLTLAQPILVNRILSTVAIGDPIRWLVVGLTLLVIGEAIIGAAQQYLLERTGEAVVLESRRGLISRLLRLTISEYDAQSAGDLITRVGADTTLVRAALTGGLVDAAGSSLVFLGALVAMFLLDGVLLGITVGVVSVAVLCVVVASARIQRLTLSAQESVGRLGAGVGRAVSAIRTIRASSATDRQIARLHAEADEAYRYGARIAKVGAVLWPVRGLALQVSFLTVLGVGGYRVAIGELAVADLVAFILFLMMMVMPLNVAFSAIATVRSALGALARIEQVMRLPVEDDGPAGFASDVPRAAELEFDGVSFAYRDGTPVLDRVDLVVPRGSTTAIVGPSGSGKSTLLALVERFYEPDQGAIRLDGVDLRDLSRAQLRAQIGYVEQSGAVLSRSIRDNLLLGTPDASDADCRDALAAVNLLKRVLVHPDGLDAQLGDHGLGLSGGEKQRLAIARVLLANPPLLLLDEPTANLDSRNEQVMQTALRSASRGRTVLIVAHRLATVADADQIVVLDGGRVVSVGRHSELLDASPLYRELASHQLLA